MVIIPFFWFFLTAQSYDHKISCRDISLLGSLRGELLFTICVRIPSTTNFVIMGLSWRVFCVPVSSGKYNSFLRVFGCFSRIYYISWWCCWVCNWNLSCLKSIKDCLINLFPRKLFFSHASTMLCYELLYNHTDQS